MEQQHGNSTGNNILVHQSPSRPRGDNLVLLMIYPLIFVPLIPILVGILGLSSQGIDKTAIETHSLNIWASALSIIGYLFALPAYLNSRLGTANPFRLSAVIAFTMGALGSISLVPMLLPNPTDNIILYIAWTCGICVVMSTVYQYGSSSMNACCGIYKESLKPFFSKIYDWFQDPAS